MMKILAAILFALLCSSCSPDYDSGGTPTKSPSSSDYCYLESNRNIFLTRSDAVSIAKASSCATSGTFTGGSFCNENFGAWWLMMEVNGTNAKAFCVIDAETRKAAIHLLE